MYYSKLAGLITPWRLGEYPARALLMAQEMHNHNHNSAKDRLFCLAAGVEYGGRRQRDDDICHRHSRNGSDDYLGDWNELGLKVIFISLAALLF